MSLKDLKEIKGVEDDPKFKLFLEKATERGYFGEHAVGSPEHARKRAQLEVKYRERFGLPVADSLRQAAAAEQ